MDNLNRPPDYFAGVRSEPFDYLPPTSITRLLSIGCAGGATEARLKQERDIAEVVGVEYEESIAAEARHHLDAVFSGDIATLALPYPPGYFDAILCLDVLEHLVDPWAVLGEKLSPLLKPGGVVLISVPNVRFWVVIWRLLRGNWAYARRSILDVGHLRFFTPRTAVQMVRDAGFSQVMMHRKYRLYDSLRDVAVGGVAGATARRVRPTSLVRRLRLFDLLFFLRDFFTFQIIVLGYKSTSGKPR